MYLPIEEPYRRIYKIYHNQYDKSQNLFFIGDIHGIMEELKELINISILPVLRKTTEKSYITFVGDLADRGPYNYKTLEWLYFCKQQLTKLYNIEIVFLIGNHDRKLINYCLNKEIKTNIEQEWFYTLNDSQKELILALFNDSPTMLSFWLNNYCINVAHGAVSNCSIKNVLDFNKNVLNVPITQKEASICYFGNTIKNKRINGFPVRLHKPVEYKNHVNINGHIVYDKDYCIKYNEPGTSIYIDHGGVFGEYLSCLKLPSIIKDNDIKNYLEIYSIKCNKHYEPINNCYIQKI